MHSKFSNIWRKKQKIFTKTYKILPKLKSSLCAMLLFFLSLAIVLRSVFHDVFTLKMVEKLFWDYDQLIKNQYAVPLPVTL